MDPSHRAIFEKLDSIFTTYSCFKEQSPAAPTKRSATSHRKQYQHVPRRKPIGGATCFDISQKLRRETQSMMNKLSPLNKDAIFSKICKYVGKDNADIAVPCILQSVVVNQLYVDLIAELLGQLEMRGIDVMKYIDGFYEDFMNHLNDCSWAEVNANPEIDYDVFCAVQKKKQQTLSKLVFCKQVPVHVGSAAILRERLLNQLEDMLATYKTAQMEFLFELCLKSNILSRDNLEELYNRYGLRDKLSRRMVLLTTHLHK